MHRCTVTDMLYSLQVDQELYFSQLQYIVLLLKLLTKENESHEPEGVFTAEEFPRLLTSYFEGKVGSEDVEKLMTAAQLELDDAEVTDVEFTRLFFEVRDPCTDYCEQSLFYHSIPK